MKFGIFKNFIITFFVILAIYQTAKLWFEDFSIHSFFYSIKTDMNDGSIEQEVGYTLKNIMFNTGNNKFICRQSDIYSKNNDKYAYDYKSSIDTAIKLAIKDNFIARSDMDWQRICDRKAIVYNYSYYINNVDIGNMFNYAGKSVSKIDLPIDCIVILPDTGFEQKLNVLFVNRQECVCYEYELRNKEALKKLGEAFNYFTLNTEGLYYTSSVKNGFQVFKNNIFIPTWENETLSYFNVTKNNPFEANGDILLAQLEKNIDLFFSNPAAKWTSNLNNVYTYSDEDTVVKYYTTGVLEYSNYKSYNTDNLQEISFFKSYIKAISFLKKDTNIKNEYYLRDYKTEDDKMIFYFDYKINGFPISLSSEIREEIEMDSIIEVTVSCNNVIKYKRYACDFEINSEGQSFSEMDFLDAIDELFKIMQSARNMEYQNNAVIDNMELGYVVREDKAVNLNWIIDIDTDKYYMELS